MPTELLLLCVVWVFQEGVSLSRQLILQLFSLSRGYVCTFFVTSKSQRSTSLVGQAVQGPRKPV